MPLLKEDIYTCSRTYYNTYTITPVYLRITVGSICKLCRKIHKKPAGNHILFTIPYGSFMTLFTHSDSDHNNILALRKATCHKGS